MWERERRRGRGVGSVGSPYNYYERDVSPIYSNQSYRGVGTVALEISKRSMTELPRNLSGKLKEIRIRAELSKTAMIRALNYKGSSLYPSDISQFERGQRQPPSLLVMAYSRFRGVPMSVLTDDDLTLD